MYRVELKVVKQKNQKSKVFRVPNVPCGVESRNKTLLKQGPCLFLMYRVELKVKNNHIGISTASLRS